MVPPRSCEKRVYSWACVAFLGVGRPGFVALARKEPIRAYAASDSTLLQAFFSLPTRSCSCANVHDI